MKLTRNLLMIIAVLFLILFVLEWFAPSALAEPDIEEPLSFTGNTSGEEKKAWL